METIAAKHLKNCQQGIKVPLRGAGQRTRILIAVNELSSTGRQLLIVFLVADSQIVKEEWLQFKRFSSFSSGK